MELIVSNDVSKNPTGVVEPFLASVQRALADADALKQLPDDYQDVTQGFLANWKRAAKQKLLHQFRRAYVDVLSRQQSAFNEQLLTALCQLADGCAALGQATAGAPQVQSDLKRVLREQKRLRRELAALGKRLDALEQVGETSLAFDERSRP